MLQQQLFLISPHFTTTEFNNFSVSDRMGEITLWNPQFFMVLGFPIWGSWHMAGCVPQKGTPLECMFSIITIGLQ